MSYTMEALRRGMASLQGQNYYEGMVIKARTIARQIREAKNEEDATVLVWYYVQEGMLAGIAERKQKGR